MTFNHALILLVLIKSAEQMPFNMTDFTCHPNENFMSETSCRLEPSRRGINLLNFRAVFHKKITSILIRFTFMKKSGASYKTFLIDSTEDICKVFDKTERSNIAHRLTDGWAKYGNFPLSCPIEGEYTMLRFPFDLSFFPSIMPGGEYRFRVILTTPPSNERLFEANAFFTIKY